MIFSSVLYLPQICGHIQFSQWCTAEPIDVQLKARNRVDWVLMFINFDMVPVLIFMRIIKEILPAHRIHAAIHSYEFKR